MDGVTGLGSFRVWAGVSLVLVGFGCIWDTTHNTIMPDGHTAEEHRL
jgi:hypothetical protein